MSTGRTQTMQGLPEEETLSSFLTPERDFFLQGLWTLWGPGAAWGRRIY